MKHINSFEKGQTLISPEIQPNQSFINGHNGQLNYNGQELSFVNKNGTLKITMPTAFNDKVKEIVGDFAFEDELILFTKNSVTETLGNVWSVKETTENNYSFTQIHEAAYNFTDGTRLATSGVNENGNYKRVYFSDGEQPFRSININYANLATLSIEELNMFPETIMEPPIVTELNDGGALKPMIVQYCYRLVSFNGNVTKFSMFSDRTVVLNSYDDIKTQNTAGVPGDNTGKSIKITIDNIDFNQFRTIEAFALQYEVKDVMTSVKSLGIANLESSSVFFNHLGTEPDASVSIDEVLINSNNFKTVKVIETYENLFLAGNIGYEPIQDYTFDSKIIQSNSVGASFTEDYNPNPQWYEYIPGTYVHGGKSNGYDTGNGIRISFITEKEDLSESTYVNANLPNVDVSLGYQNELVSLLGDYDSFGNKAFNESIRYSPNKASYQRGEIYRLAFKASKDGKDSFVKYIGDIKIPSIDDSISYLNGDTAVFTTDKYNVSINENNKVKGIAIYLKVDLKLPQAIIDNYDFFEILRVKRDSTNKTIIDQGVLFPTADKDLTDTSTTSENYPSGYQYQQGVQLPKKISFINYVGLYLREVHYKLGNVYSFDSPRVVSQLQDYQENSFNKIKILSSLEILKYENKLIDAEEYNAYAPSGGHYFINTGNYHRHVLYSHEEIATRNINVENEYFAGENQIVPSGKIPEKDTYQLANIGLPTWSGENERQNNFYVSVLIDSLYYDNPRQCRFKMSSAAPTLFLKLETDYLAEFVKNTFDGTDYSKFPFLDTKGILSYNTSSGNAGANDRMIVSGDVIISNLVLVNLERDLSNQYGGRNEFAISQNQYISIHKEKISGNTYSLEVGNGDIYIDMFHHQKFSLKNTPEYPGDFIGISQTGDAATDKPVSVTSSISVALETDLPQIFSKGDKLIKSGVNIDSGEVYVFNDAYVSQEAKVSITKPFNFEEVTEFPNLIQVSDIKLNGNSYDSWSVFKSANFHELDLDKGGITNFIRIKDLLFATQSNKGLSQIFINPRAIIPSSDGRNITIGSSSPVNIEYSKEISKYGTSFLNSIAVSDDAFMYFNDKYQKLILFKGGVLSVSDSTFNQNSFYEKLKGKVINSVTGVYDERYSEMILCINYGSNENISISYNCDNKFNLFNGTSDFISNHFINFQNKVFAKNDLNELHIKNEGSKGSYFETVKDFELEFVVNPSIEDVKIFDNFIGVINSSGIKFKSLSFKTNLVPEQTILAADTRYKIREGRHLVPYREIIGKPRMRGDYMIVKLVFDNSQNKNISITSVISAVRKSFK
jgi:hypothetical protein